jgi:hypothetical protein
MTILAIDPGTNESAFVRWNGNRILEFGIVENSILLHRLENILPEEKGEPVYCEMIASYGMAVGKEVYETILWIGQFVHACKMNCRKSALIYRKDVKMHLCHSMKAKDGNIRQAILDRFGGKDLAIGKKKSQGIFYGVSSHTWAALAIAIYTHDTKHQGVEF